MSLLRKKLWVLVRLIKICPNYQKLSCFPNSPWHLHIQQGSFLWFRCTLLCSMKPKYQGKSDVQPTLASKQANREYLSCDSHSNKLKIMNSNLQSQRWCLHYAMPFFSFQWPENPVEHFQKVFEVLPCTDPLINSDFHNHERHFQTTLSQSGWEAHSWWFD